jgi:hypothetical protein
MVDTHMIYTTFMSLLLDGKNDLVIQGEQLHFEHHNSPAKIISRGAKLCSPKILNFLFEF